MAAEGAVCASNLQASEARNLIDGANLEAAERQLGGAAAAHDLALAEMAGALEESEARHLAASAQAEKAMQVPSPR